MFDAVMAVDFKIPDKPQRGYNGVVTKLVPGFRRITVNPDILAGKPCVRGMRLSVEQFLYALASHPKWDDLKRNYPSLEPEDLPEVLRFAALQMGGDYHPLDLTAAK